MNERDLDAIIARIHRNMLLELLALVGFSVIFGALTLYWIS